MGSLLGLPASWRATSGSPGGIPDVITTQFELGKRSGFTPVVILGFADDSPRGPVLTIDWSDPAQRDAFRRMAVAIADKYHPRFLGIGNEVNRIWMVNPQAFDLFVAAYAEIYDAVKAVSPRTQVFTVFQLELMKGGGFLVDGARSRPPQWDLVERFAGKLDLVAFTTYPFLDYKAPADIPDDYFREAAARVRRPIALTEVGWPSRPIAGAEASGYGGTPEEQAEFVRRLFTLLAGVRPSFVLWSFPHDIGPGPSVAFASVSLRENDGTAKPALEVWRQLTR